MINKDGGGTTFRFYGGGGRHSCYEWGHRAHGGPPVPPTRENPELWSACILFSNYKTVVYKPINLIVHVTCPFKIPLNNKDKKTPRVSLGQGL